MVQERKNPSDGKKRHRLTRQEEERIFSEIARLGAYVCCLSKIQIELGHKFGVSPCPSPSTLRPRLRAWDTPTVGFWGCPSSQKSSALFTEDSGAEPRRLCIRRLLRWGSFFTQIRMIQ